MSRIAVATIKTIRPAAGPLVSTIEGARASLKVFLPEVIFALAMVAAAFGLRVMAFWHY